MIAPSRTTISLNAGGPDHLLVTRGHRTGHCEILPLSTLSVWFKGNNTTAARAWHQCYIHPYQESYEESVLFLFPLVLVPIGSTTRSISNSPSAASDWNCLLGKNWKSH